MINVVEGATKHYIEYNCEGGNAKSDSGFNSEPCQLSLGLGIANDLRSNHVHESDGGNQDDQLNDGGDVCSNTVHANCSGEIDAFNFL